MPPDAFSLHAPVYMLARGSRVEPKMYRRVFIASHRYAFSTPAVAFDIFIGAVKHISILNYTCCARKVTAIDESE